MEIVLLFSNEHEDEGRKKVSVFEVLRDYTSIMRSDYDTSFVSKTKLITHFYV